MSDNKYVVLNKEMLEQCLKDLASNLKKRIKDKNVHCELIIVGGASIILNYGFRQSTFDIDCTDEQKILMNDVINSVARKNNLPLNWINTDFMNSSSYSKKIYQYSSFYKSYGNGVLVIRTIKDEYLLAMKVMSGRKYKNDYSDICGIIVSCNEENRPITKEKLDRAITDLYGSIDLVNQKAYELALKIINDPKYTSIEELRKAESNNLEIVKESIEENTNQETIDYVLSKLEIDK